MTELVADCPRCNSKQMTFDIKSDHVFRTEYGWKHWYEAFSVCRRCLRSTTFFLSTIDLDRGKAVASAGGIAKLPMAVNRFLRVEGVLSIADFATAVPPEHLPKDIEAAFNEGAKCRGVSCYNAAGTMFRLCIDIASRSLLPATNDNGLNDAIRRSLGLRLRWLFDRGLLPEALRELSHCVKEDGNDGAHAGSLSKEDADDLLDFTFQLLARMYTEPERIRLAEERRKARRSGA